MMCFKRENIDLDREEISLFNSEKRPNVFEAAKTKWKWSIDTFQPTQNLSRAHRQYIDNFHPQTDLFKDNLKVSRDFRQH